MAWNGSSEKGKAPALAPKLAHKSPPSKAHGLIALVVIVIAGGLAAWFFLGRDIDGDIRETGKPTKPTKIAEVKPRVATNAVAEMVGEEGSNTKKKPAPPPFVKRPGALQLNDGKVLTFPVPKEGELRLVHAYGHTYECDHLGNFRDITPRKLFHTAFEANFLALSCEGKPFIPAFLTGLDEADVKKILLKDYKPIGDETEDEMASLRNYFDMKCAALEYMEQGGKFDDFVNDIAKFEKDQRTAQATSLREIMTLYKEGKLEEAKSMAEAADVLMQKKGYKPVRLPAHVQERLGLAPNE